MDTQIIQDFITIFLGITVEATPFLVLGVIVSVVVEMFVSQNLLRKIIPKNRFISHPLIAFAGVLLPVCECGNVPVARRLMLDKFSVSQTITFLLAAPIINPITILSTKEAFGFDTRVVVFRVLAAYFIAVSLGLILSFYRNQNKLVTAKFNHEIEICDHDHSDENKFFKSLDIFSIEFISTFKLLLVGAFIASLTQTFVPRSVIEDIGSDPLTSILAMAALAFIVSICANIDAFFALAYVNTFTLGSLLTFMIFGPMVDMKIIAMLKNTFKFRFIMFVTAYCFVFSVLAGLIFNQFFG